MKTFAKFVLSCACAALVLPAVASAESIASFTTSLTSANNTQLGRPYRSGTPQDWAGDEPYDGVTGSANTYYYRTFLFNSSLFAGAPYVEITDFEPGNTGNYFLTAYADRYRVNSRGTNWLGDAGFSGNYQTNDSGFFDVVLPTGSDLVLVLNSTAATGIAPGTNIQITVDAFADTMYDDPVATTVTPEPSSFLLLGTGLTGALAMVRRRGRILA